MIPSRIGDPQRIVQAACNGLDIGVLLGVVYRLDRLINGSENGVITKKTKYALMALAAMAEGDWRQPKLIADLSRDAGVPKKFLELILLELKNGGVVLSKKGPGGGYFLAMPPEKVNVAEVMRLSGGAIAPVGCLSKTRYEACSECPEERTCGVRLVLREVHEASIRVLERTKLTDMMRFTREAGEAMDAAPMYYI